MAQIETSSELLERLGGMVVPPDPAAKLRGRVFMFASSGAEETGRCLAVGYP